MKRLLGFFIIAFSLFMGIGAHADELSLSERFSGQILLQVESYGRAWYVDPVDGERYYLKDGATAFSFMRDKGLGISNADLERIPHDGSEGGDTDLVARLSGRILLQVEERGEAWYVNPQDGQRYYLADGDAAYDIMRAFSTGISNSDLATIPMNSVQLVHDTTFDDVAYVHVRNGEVVEGGYEDQILPPASMSKLMTALVLLDLEQFDFDSLVTISESAIAYPRDMVGGDTTSEVGIRAGDVVSAYDLWVAMLMASSNQATIALVDSTGLSRAEFSRLMTQKALELGLLHTVFYDPSGLDAHNVTTSREMAIIAREAFDVPVIAAIGAMEGYSIQTKGFDPRAVWVQDRNYSLKTYGADASKTGYLDEAQRCVALKRGEDIVVVMHARSMGERNGILDEVLSSQ